MVADLRATQRAPVVCGALLKALIQVYEAPPRPEMASSHFLGTRAEMDFGQILPARHSVDLLVDVWPVILFSFD